MWTEPQTFWAWALRNCTDGTHIDLTLPYLKEKLFPTNSSLYTLSTYYPLMYSRIYLLIVLIGFCC